jgi:hypothetical protein
MKNILTLLLVFSLFVSQTFGQVYTNKVVGAKNETLKDSLEAAEYPYALPILGAQVAKRGYDLPYSAGIGVNYFWQKSDIIIENLYVGFNNGPMYDLDEIVRMNNAISTSSAINLRPDIWILPFLNVYGLKPIHPRKLMPVSGFLTLQMNGMKSPAFLQKLNLRQPGWDLVLLPL